VVRTVPEGMDTPRDQFVWGALTPLRRVLKAERREHPEISHALYRISGYWYGSWGGTCFRDALASGEIVPDWSRFHDGHPWGNFMGCSAVSTIYGPPSRGRRRPVNRVTLIIGPEGGPGG